MNEQKSDYKQTLQVDISLAIYGSSRPQIFQKRDVLKNFLKFTEQQLLKSLLNKVAAF